MPSLLSEVAGFKVLIDVLWSVDAGSTWFMNSGYMNSMATYRRHQVSVQTPRAKHTQGPTVLLYVLCVQFFLLFRTKAFLLGYLFSASGQIDRTAI